MGKKEGKPAPTAENVKVIVRCRPLSEKETVNGASDCVELNVAASSVQVNNPFGAPDKWTFDAVVNNGLCQGDIFTQHIQPMCQSVLDGFNATVFAYGQSGSGKTHTMTGKLDDPELRGVIPRTFDFVFDHIRESTTASPNRAFSLSCTFIELYNGKVRDLLAKQQVTLSVKENKDKTFFVQGVNQPTVKSAADLLRFMDEGTERRKVASTELNSDSSRSHSVFTLMIDCVEISDEGDKRAVSSKFNLVDLAGSERQTKTQASGDTLKEGCNINLSLSALGTVIDTIVKGKGHVPFRSSQLTMLLKDSLGGNSKTCMFANINPSDKNQQETVSTLRFADRAKQIKNKPMVNLDAKDQRIAELMDQVAALKSRLAKFAGGVDESPVVDDDENGALKDRVAELEVVCAAAEETKEAVSREAEQEKLRAQAKAAEMDEQVRCALARADNAEADLAVAQQRMRDIEARRMDLLGAVECALGPLPVTASSPAGSDISEAVPESDRISVDEIRHQLGAMAVKAKEATCQSTTAVELPVSQAEVKLLEAIAAERESQATALRTTVDKQSKILERTREAKAAAEMKTKELELRITNLQYQHKAELDERDAAFQRHLAAQVDAAIANRREAGAAFEETAKKYKKKYKKAQSKLTEVENAHDEKMVEIARLTEMLEEARIGQLQFIRQQQQITSRGAEPDITARRQGESGFDTMARVRDDRRRRASLFEAGEMPPGHQVVAGARATAAAADIMDRFSPSPPPARRSSIMSSRVAPSTACTSRRSSVTSDFS